MKDYTFRLLIEDAHNKNYLKKKQFKLKLKNEIDDDTMFVEAIDYLGNNIYDFFNVKNDEVYIDFKIVRGNKTATCELESEACPCCGGYAQIFGGYDE